MHRPCLWILALEFAAGCAWAQENSGAFYWYGNRKIALKAAANAVAAKVAEPVDYARKFPWINKYFKQVSSSDLRDEPVLLKTASVTQTASMLALKSGVKSQEIYQLPVYEIGKSKVIVQNELVVRFKEDQTDAARAEALLRKFSKTFVRLPGPGIRYLVRVPDPTRTLAWADMLHGNKTVAYAEPNFVLLQPSRPVVPAGTAVAAAAPDPALASEVNAAAGFPSDPYYPQQWGLKKIRAAKAWTTTRGSAAIRIAVLDDGVDVGHKDLQDKIEKSYDLLFDSDVMNPPAADSHGTAVAGIAAAATNNAFGVAGLAAGVKLIPVRMMSQVENGTEANTIVVVSNAFAKAIELGADVINCSWTMPVPSQDVEGAIQAAVTRGRNSRGAVVVFAAGNDGSGVSFPASLAQSLPVLAVGASNENDEFKTAASSDREDFWASNFGPELNVAAPGVHIVTTAHRGSVPAGSDPFTTGFDGTSSAAPFVSALAALILSVEPDLTPGQVRDRIVKSADMVLKMPDPAGTQIGRINACRALGRSDCNQ